MSEPEPCRGARSSPGLCRRAGWIAVVLLTASGTGHAQSREGGDFGASSQTVKQGGLPHLTRPPGTAPPAPAPPPRPAPPLPPPRSTPGPSASEDPISSTALMPPPSSYLSSVWTLWPHAWGYVPSLWSTWYADFARPSKAAGQAEPAGTGSPSVTIVDSLKISPPPHILPTPKPGLGLTDDSQKLPPPRLVHQRRYNLVISGIGILVATWGADRLLANSLSTAPQTWVPLVGPWFLLGEQSALASPSRQVQVLLVFDGLLQAGGLSMALLGFVLTTKRYVVTVKPRSSDLAPQEVQ